MFNYKITKEDGADLTIRGGSICYVSAEKLVAQSVYMALQLNVGDYKFDATKEIGRAHV